MPTRLLASVIVCVALLTQFGASLWAATAAREGDYGCRKSVAWTAPADAAQADAHRQPAHAPAGHDHASCTLCQLSFAVIPGDAPISDAQPLVYRRLAAAEPGEPAPARVINRGAPARAPPSQA